MKEKTNNPKAPMPEAEAGPKPTGKPTKSDDYKGERIPSKTGGKPPMDGTDATRKVHGDKLANHGGKPGGGKGGL